MLRKIKNLSWTVAIICRLHGRNRPTFVNQHPFHEVSERLVEWLASRALPWNDFPIKFVFEYRHVNRQIAWVKYNPCVRLHLQILIKYMEYGMEVTIRAHCKDWWQFHFFYALDPLLGVNFLAVVPLVIASGVSCPIGQTTHRQRAFAF